MFKYVVQLPLEYLTLSGDTYLMYTIYIYMYHSRYRVFNLQVLDSRAAQLGALWTKMTKFFFSEFLKTQCFCQASKTNNISGNFGGS